MDVKQKCDRCRQKTIGLQMSLFNTEMCCHTCILKERAHPLFQKARQAEIEAISRGDYNFPGIGLPEDLRILAIVK